MIVDITTKIILIGDVATGKTSFMRKYVTNNTTSIYESTLGVDYLLKRISHKYNGIDYNIKLQIWDTAGMEHYRSLTSIYYKGASYIFIFIDLSNHNPYQINLLPTWYNNIIRHTDTLPKIILIGNKSDKDLGYTDDKVKKWLSKHSNILYFKTSIYDITTIEKVFQYIIKELIKQNKPHTGYYKEIELKSDKLLEGSINSDDTKDKKKSLWKCCFIC
jgi:Ras-related protein Rab-25